MTDVEVRAETVRLICDSLGFLARDDRMETVRKIRHSDTGFDMNEWRTVAELGLLGMRVPEDRGGAGLGLVEAIAVVEEFGRHLAPHALANAIVSAPLLPDGILDSVLQGDKIALPAWQEDPVDPLVVHATMRDELITGVKSFIPYARAATDFLVLTTSGFVSVERESPGVSLDSDRLHDGSHFGALRLDGVRGEKREGSPAALLAELFLCNAAYMLGVAERAFEITRQYIHTREQFGRPIGSFQALQHRAVDMLLEIRLLRAGLSRLAAQIDDGRTTASLAPSVSRIMACAAMTVMSVTRRSVQMHGGMGFTDEADIGLYLRKAMVMANAMGSPKWHRSHFAELTNVANDRRAA